MNKTDNIFLIQQKLQQQKKVDEKSTSLNNTNKNIKLPTLNNNNNDSDSVSFSASTSSPAPSSPFQNKFNKNTSPTSASPISTLNNNINIKKNVTTTSISSISSSPNITNVKKTPPPPVPPRKYITTPPLNITKNLPKTPPPPVPPKPKNMILNKNNNDLIKNNNMELNNNTNNIEEISNHKNNETDLINNKIDKLIIENKCNQTSNEIQNNEDKNIIFNNKKEKETEVQILIVTPPPPTVFCKESNIASNEYIGTPNISVTPPSISTPLESPQCNSPELINSLPNSNPSINIINSSENDIASSFINIESSSIDSPNYSSTESTSPSLSNSLEIKSPSSSKPPRDPNSSPIFVKRSVSIVENLNQKSSLSPNNPITTNINTRKINTSEHNTSGCIAPPPSPSSCKILVNQTLTTSQQNVLSKSDGENSPPRRVLTRRVGSSNLLKDNSLTVCEQSGRTSVFVMSNSSYNLRGGSKDEDDDEYVDTTNIFRKPSLASISRENSPPPTPGKHQRTQSLNNEQQNPRDSVNYSASAFNLRDSFEKIIPGINKNEIKMTLIDKLDSQHSKIQNKPPRKLKLPAIDSTTRLNKRIAEMIETEADYIDDLETTLNLYLFAFTEMEKLKIISQNDIKSIFSNIEEVYHVSLKLFPMLLKTIPLLEQKQYPNIEEIFLNNYKAFQRYGSYLSSYESSNKYLENLIEKNEIVKFTIDYIKNKLPMSKLLDLHAYQIKPCQRLCKYPLLLKDAKSAVPESEESNHKTFERAVKLMEKIVNDINGKITNDEKIQSIIKEVGKEIETLIHHQTFIKECKVKKLKSKKNAAKEIQLYLLDQYLILYEKGMIKKKYKLISFSKVSRVCDHECKSPNSFGIYYSREGGGTTKTLSLQLDSNKDKTDLMNLVDETLQSFKYISGDNNKFLYITNDNNGFNTTGRNSNFYNSSNLNTNNTNNIKQKNNNLDIVFF